MNQFSGPPNHPDSENTSTPHHHVPREIPIIVNGREKTVDRAVLSFDEIVRLAFESPPVGEFICFTITYRHGCENRPEGTVPEGGVVRVRAGMVFNVTATDKS